MAFFPYDQHHTDYLAKADPTLGALIVRLGAIERPIVPDLFQGLIESIIAQQISRKAADTVTARLTSLAGEIAPASLATLPVDVLQGCGLSYRKVGYIQGIARAALSGGVDFHALKEKGDEQAIEVLDRLPGVGVWTAQMLLIFSLCRLNVISYDDLGIRRGMMRLYGLETLSRQDFQRYADTYAPYASVASLYLWALAAEA